MRCAYLAHLMALLHRLSILSGREWDLPVLLSRPANTMGSMLPSSSGRATYAMDRALFSTTDSADAMQSDSACGCYLPKQDGLDAEVQHGHDLSQAAGGAPTDC